MSLRYIYIYIFISAAEFKEQPYHGFCYPLSEGQRVQMASPVLVRRSPPSESRRGIQSPPTNNTSPVTRGSSISPNSPDSRPLYVTSPQSSRRSPIVVGDPIKIVVPSSNAVQSPPNTRRYHQVERQPGSQGSELPEFSIRVVGPQGTSAPDQPSYQNGSRLMPQNQHQPLGPKLSPCAGVSNSTIENKRIPSLQHRVTPIAQPDMDTETRMNKMIEDGRRISMTKKVRTNSALNSFLAPAGANERVSKRISPPKLDRSTAKNIITAHINQMIGGYPDQSGSKSPQPVVSKTSNRSPKSPTFYKVYYFVTTKYG